MSDYELTTAISDYRQYKRMMEDLQVQIDDIKARITEHMSKLSLDTIAGIDYKVTWKDTCRTSIDSKALKRDYPDIATQYSNTSVSKRFVVQ